MRGLGDYKRVTTEEKEESVMNMKQLIQIRLGVSPSELVGYSMVAVFLSILSPLLQEARGQCSADELEKLLASDGTTLEAILKPFVELCV